MTLRLIPGMSSGPHAKTLEGADDAGLQIFGELGSNLHDSLRLGRIEREVFYLLGWFSPRPPFFRFHSSGDGVNAELRLANLLCNLKVASAGKLLVPP